MKTHVAAILGIVVVILIGGAWYIYHSSGSEAPVQEILEERSDVSSEEQTKAPNPMSTYTSTRLGFAFEYPTAWGQPVEIVKEGCRTSDYPDSAERAVFQARQANGEPCTSVILAFSGTYVLSAASTLFAEYPSSGEGEWSTSSAVARKKDSSSFTSSSEALCENIVTSQGVPVRRCDRITEYGDGPTTLRNTYFVYLAGASHPGIFISSIRFTDDAFEAPVDALIDSLRLVR